MNAKSAHLPEFEVPPVSEVAIAVEFATLENWRGPHAGLYWSEIQSRYPHAEVQSPIPSQIEKFGEEFWQRPAFNLIVGDPDISRSWFLAEPKTKLIQVQRDRFVINWRKITGDEAYPRYLKELRLRFETEWRQFKDFIRGKNIGDVSVRQCEITYVNDIVKGEGWSDFPEALALFAPQWPERHDVFLPLPETLNVNGSFLMPDEAGRLHFGLHHVRRQTDNREVVQLRLIARGKPKSGSDEEILRWMDMGHEWIVRGFVDLTSQRAHEIWKLKVS